MNGQAHIEKERSISLDTMDYNTIFIFLAKFVHKIFGLRFYTKDLGAISIILTWKSYIYEMRYLDAQIGMHSTRYQLFRLSYQPVAA